MDKSAKFWDRIANRYARRPVADDGVYQTKLTVTQEYLNADMEVLELGCGTGSTAIIHAPFVKHIRAIDVSPKMIEIARRKADAGQIDNVTFEVSSVDDLQMNGQLLDAVLALNVLHLLNDRDDVIARIYQVLKPGGVFVSSTVCLGGSMWWLRAILPIGKSLGWLPSINFFGSDELKQVLLDAGFEIDHFWQPEKAQSVFIVARKSC
jgi:ubiquinone/menaquinone biosynthesis C-methylase UbiE